MLIGVGKAFGLPSLRTVRAVFPHTALQSVVSSSRLSRCLPDRVKGERPGIREGAFPPPVTSLPTPTARTPSTPRLRRTPSCARPAAPCLASSALTMLFCLDMIVTRPPSCPAFPWTGFASPSSNGPCTRPQRYYAGSDSSPGRTPRRGLSAYSALPSRHSVLNHAGCPSVALSVASAPRVGSRLRHERAGSPQPSAESGSLSYGLPVHLRMLSTPPRGDAVSFDYGVATNSGTDSHRSVKASSRTHSSPINRSKCT